jgi:hypothetical protein
MFFRCRLQVPSPKFVNFPQSSKLYGKMIVVIVLFLAVLGFDLRASCLLCRCCYCLSHHTSPKIAILNQGLVKNILAIAEGKIIMSP